MAFVWKTAQVYVVRWINRVLGRQWSFIIIGASGVGKTGLIEVLTNEEPNVTYFATEEPRFYNIPGASYSVTEIPGSTHFDQGLSRILLSRFDLIISVFHENKPETANYYKSLWAGAPPAPVVFVGNNAASADVDPTVGPNKDVLGLRLQRTLEGGVVCAYFPVSYTDKETCRELLLFLSLGAWKMRQGAEHLV